MTIDRITAAICVALCACAALGCNGDADVGPTTPESPDSVQPSDGPADVEPADASLPPPPAALAGLRGMRVETRVVLDEPVGRVYARSHRWTFPERWRAESLPEGGDLTQRELIYRFGQRSWRLPAGSLASEALAPETAALLAVEDGLRRAALLWPDGHDWQLSGSVERAALLDRCAEGVELYAELDSDGRPSRIEARGSAGTMLSIAPSDWRAEGHRTIPGTLRFERAGAAWTETVERIDYRAYFLDKLFVPVDVALASEAPPPPAVALPIEIDEVPRRAQRRFELEDQDRSYAIALTRSAERVRATIDDSRSGAVADAVIEVGDDGRPVAVVVRLAPGSAELPGFELPEPRRGLSIAVLHPEAPGLVAGALAQLRRAGRGVEAGPPYLFGAESARLLVVIYAR